MGANHTAAGTQVVLVLAFLGLNTAFNLFNKWIFTPVEKDGAGLSVPIFATITHSLAGFFTAMVLRSFPSIYVPKEISGTREWLQVGMISLFFASTIGLNNSSLMYLPLSIQQTVRACSPVVLAGAAYLIEKKTFSWQQIASLMGLTIGIIFTVMSNDSADLVGVLLAAGSVLVGTLYYTYISLVMGPEGKMNVLDILLYTTIPVVVILTPVFFITSEHNVLAEFTEANGIEKTLLLLLIGCIFAVSYNIMTFTFIAMLSAVYLSVVANFKLVLLIIFGIFMFGENINALNALGLAVATVAFCSYSYYEFKARKQKETEESTKKVDS